MCVSTVPTNLRGDPGTLSQPQELGAIIINCSKLLNLEWLLHLHRDQIMSPHSTACCKLEGHQEERGKRKDGEGEAGSPETWAQGIVSPLASRHQAKENPAWLVVLTHELGKQKPCIPVHSLLAPALASPLLLHQKLGSLTHRAYSGWVPTMEDIIVLVCPAQQGILGSEGPLSQQRSWTAEPRV